MQYIDIVNEVLDFGFNDGPQVNRARIARWVNEGQGRLAREADGPEFQSTAAITTAQGVQSYALPGDFIRDMDITFPEMWGRLTPIDASAFDNQTGDPATAWQGPPGAYALYQGNILLSPLPDGEYALSMRYVASPPDLVNDSDVPVLNVAYHHLLITYAVMRGYEAEDDPEMANYWAGRWQADKAKYASDVNNRERDTPRLVAGAWSTPQGYGLWR